MSDKRKPISELIGTTISDIIDGPAGGYLYFLDNRGKIMLQVKREDLFDADGMRLEDDT